MWFGSMGLGWSKMLAHRWWLWQSRKALLARLPRRAHTPRAWHPLCLWAWHYLVRLLDE